MLLASSRERLQINSKRCMLHRVDPPQQGINYSVQNVNSDAVEKASVRSQRRSCWGVTGPADYCVPAGVGEVMTVPKQLEVKLSPSSLHFPARDLGHHVMINER